MSLLLILGFVPAAAEDDVVWSIPTVDPVRWSSAPLDPAEADAPPQGHWQWTATTGYFNIFRGSAHVRNYHEQQGLVGQPLTSAELDAIEDLYVNQDIFRIDVEGWRKDVHVSRGFRNGYSLNFRISAIDIGRPNWDGISFDFHKALGIGQNDRGVFPRGQTVVYVHTSEKTIEFTDDLDGSGIADAGISLSGPAGEWLRGDHRWVVSLDVPVGDENSLAGSGGWDVGLRWFGHWAAGRRGHVRVAAGYSWLDSNGSWLGAERNDTWHAFAEYGRPLTRRVSFRIAGRFDRSPIDEFTSTRVGRSTLVFYIGTRVALTRTNNSWIAFDFGEDWPSFGLGPDFSFHIQLGTRIGGPRVNQIAEGPEIESEGVASR